MSKPTIIIVHGSWHAPAHFDRLIGVLGTKHGYKCIPVDLPSMRGTHLPPATLTDDSNAIRSAILSELDEAGNDVILLAHSYGGAPTTNSPKGLDHKSRTAQGKSTCVREVLFIAAFPLPLGVTFIGYTNNGKPAPLHDLSQDPNFAYVHDPVHYFYNTCTPEDQESAKALLRPQSWAAYEEKTTYASHMDFDTGYLVCERDQAIPAEFQRKMIQEREAESGRKMEVESLEADHSPFLCKVEEVAGWVVGHAEGK
jgi:hypothetical protein